MILPTIHLNGTSPEALYEQQAAVAEKLRAAIRALDEAAPNARDYYTQGQGAFYQANNEHSRRILALQAVLQHTQEVMEYIADYLP